MDLNIKILEKSFLGSLLLSLYYTGNITKGNINKYNKKLLIILKQIKKLK